MKARWTFPAAAAALAAFLVPAAASAGVETVTTYDGWTLPVEVLLPEGAGEETPAVMLLHGDKGNRRNWQGLAGHLQKLGYAVFVPDLRKHGEASLAGRTETGEEMKPRDYQNLVNIDLEAVKTLILSYHAKKQLNVRQFGVVAAEETAPAALLFTFNDWRKQPLRDAPALEMRTPTGMDVRAVALLTPSEDVPGLNPNRILRRLGDDGADIAFLVLVGAADAARREVGEEIVERIAGDDGKERVSLVTVPGALPGTAMLRPPLGEGLYNGFANPEGRGFLDRYVKDRSGPADAWRDRTGNL